MDAIFFVVLYICALSQSVQNTKYMGMKLVLIYA